MIKNPTVSAILSFILPGAGQFYNGDIMRGIFWLFCALLFHIPLLIFTMGGGNIMGLILHAIPAYTAYKRAHEINTVMGGYYQV